jgi:hypothetical protein
MFGSSPPLRRMEDHEHTPPPPRFVILGTTWIWVVSFTVRLTLLSAKEPLNRGLCVPQRSSSSGSVQNKALFYRESKPGPVVSYFQSRGSSVGIVTDYGLDYQSSGVWFPEVAVNSSLLHRVQIGSGAHPASYPMGTWVAIRGGEAAEAWSWPLTSCMALFLHPNTSSWRGA